MDLKTVLVQSPLPSFESEILLAFLLQKKREFILAHPERRITEAKYIKFRKLEKKRLAGYSVAHLIGQKEFFSLKFKVTKDTLVPRPLTELLVEEIINIIQSIPQATIIDIGTGSGAIIVATAKELKKTHPNIFKKDTFIATDISPAALKVAKENIKYHHLDTKIKTYQGDLLSALKNKDFQHQELIISANLPYLSPHEIKSLPTIQKEVRSALVGGFDGLRLYKKLFQQLNKVSCKKFTCICEFNAQQKIAIHKLAQKYIPDVHCRFKKDLANKTRFMIIER